MNIRHYKLYEYLLDKEDQFTPQHQVARDLYEYYGNGECCLEPKDYHNTAERVLITKDIREINDGNTFEKIIISNSKGIKLATEEEFNAFIKRQYNSAIRKLARIYRIAKKGNRHNQIDFGGHTVEAFLEKLPEDIDN